MEAGHFHARRGRRAGAKGKAAQKEGAQKKLWGGKAGTALRHEFNSNGHAA
ncbi:hypothetical protein SBA_ch1_13540 [Sphingomonas bisphenolicum]|uniref:Uncharacterized protein n=1 Tax=Sphingomonas bisphenolicum TaxID=296544 RepID=A0ABN5WA38_9SPHN|nr:hypothetical protein SBA_ch1_13540 [Sphingomonas bisphenolicum]